MLQTDSVTEEEEAECEGESDQEHHFEEENQDEEISPREDEESQEETTVNGWMPLHGVEQQLLQRAVGIRTPPPKL